MDGILEFLPFIIAALIFVVRLFAKKNPPQSTEPTTTTTEQPNSFEDLLKQITKQINEAKEQPTTKQTASEKIQTAKNQATINKEKGLSEIERKKDQHFKAYEVKETKPKKENTPLVSKYISEAKVKEVFKGEKGITKEERKKDQHFNAYQIQKQKQNKFAVILKNKDSFKNALIINELMNRKYF